MKKILFLAFALLSANTLYAAQGNFRAEGGAVDSVNGNTGTVVLEPSDFSCAENIAPSGGTLDLSASDCTTVEIIGGVNINTITGLADGETRFIIMQGSPNFTMSGSLQVPTFSDGETWDVPNDSKPTTAMLSRENITYFVHSVVLPDKTVLGSFPRVIDSITGTGNTGVIQTVHVADASGGAVEIDAPITTIAGQQFWVSDGNGNAATNNITVDFNLVDLHGTAQNYIIDVNEKTVGFTYIDATVGWIIHD